MHQVNHMHLNCAFSLCENDYKYPVIIDTYTVG